MARRILFRRELAVFWVLKHIRSVPMETR
jgi:hypothetical protein